MKRMPKDKTKKFSEDIDSKFADIQRYIYECEYLPEDKKTNMISLCIECNDMIIRIHDNQSGNVV